MKWQRITIMMFGLLVIVGSSVAMAAPGDDASSTASAGSVSGDQLPQGIDVSADLPGTASNEVVAYQPISESMLPQNANPSNPSQAATLKGAAVPTATNLGGATTFTMGPYTLGRDDVINIVVQGQPDFTGTYVIGPDGTIQYGFLGDVKADGLTKDELAQVLAEKLKKFVRTPTVRITIAAFTSKAIYILGRVARPGKYAMRGDSVKIRDAVIAAGLVVRHAKLRTGHIVKSDPTNPSFRVIDLFKVLYKGKMKENIELVNGDIVVVPTTIWGGINDFLTELISPTGHAGSVAALAAL